jgi:serine protease AprX
MRRAGLLALLAAGIPAAAGAQVPRTLSPRLAPLLSRQDTAALVWVIARPGAALEDLAERVRAAGGRVRHLSRFVNAVSAVVPSGALAAVARSRDVQRVQAVGVYYRPSDETCGPPDAPACRAAAPPAAVAGAARGAAQDTLYGAGAWAVRQLGTPALHALGLRGAGVRVALLDGGFNTLHPYLAGATIVAQHDFVYGDSVVRDQPGEAQGEMAHGTATWSLIAANAPGFLFGEANQARFLLYKTEYGPTETRVEEDHWVAAVEQAESLGVDIISSSLGYLSFDNGFSYTFAQLNGDFAVTTLAARAAARRGTLVVVSIGNSGPGARTLGTPADADSIVAVGATDSAAALAFFSSRGPTADGRHKPEVLAPGVAVTVAAMSSGLGRGSGTSFSAPLIAGLAALVQGTRLGRPAVDLRRGLLNAGANRAAPNDSLGWGVPDALRFLAFPAGLAPAGPTDSLLATATPTFAWQVDQPGGFGPDTFRLRVAADRAFTQPVLDTITTGATVTLAAGARPGARLYWRLDARSPLGVADSIPVQGPFVAPAWATLLTLASPGGQSIRDSQPVFAWRSPAVAAPPGPFRYDVAVYPASLGPTQAVASAVGLTDTTFRITRPLEHNLPFRWRVVARLGADSAVVTSPGTFVVIDDAMPATTLLYQNFPNPFPNARVGLFRTCIWFDVAQGGAVQLGVFDLRGRLVRRLAPGPAVPADLVPGHYGRPPGDVPGSCDPRFAWDGRDETGAFVRPGVYLYRLTAPGFQDAKRIVFLGAP